MGELGEIARYKFWDATNIGKAAAVISEIDAARCEIHSPGA